jgi:hypothetical protein
MQEVASPDAPENEEPRATQLQTVMFWTSRGGYGLLLPDNKSFRFF